METKDRVRESTPDKINRQIDQQIEAQVASYSGASKAAIRQRIDELNGEWDLERALATTAASFTISGVLLGTWVDKRWLILPGVVASFLLQHSLQGWCPPLAVFRALKFRNRREIEREKVALKVLKGDFDALSSSSSPQEILPVLQG
ncbi:DUF2892 domain-containing protein [Cesiribacter andamanensis]|uniref:DUF2892 domain-containing protein n=1 Tax=Cesiribacter andamanensis AMV16 TaxID=1279009 RepID=M7N7W0_9BACT|nr:DUF2892 domain-containing protein [Cesiribacter andamanensis]EMR03332.1 hypothetical protein ADICEAN_01509 [Cesiribacter andamanensis AMV16]